MKITDTLIWTTIAAVLSLPGGLFLAFAMSQPRARLLSLLGGIVGAVVVAAAVYDYITAGKVRVDAISYFLGTFFACSMGVLTGALVVNFLVGLAGRGPRMTSPEY
jgi:hypothetical protein